MFLHRVKKAIPLVALLITNCVASAQNSTTNYSDAYAPVGNKALTVPKVVKPLFNQFMRDTYVTLGPDGYYYMTGTTPPTQKDGSKGIYMWRSTDMKDWQLMGCIWSMDKDATWQKSWRPAPATNRESQLPDAAYRGVWAPEIHYIKSKKQWLIIACLSHGGSFVLKSTSGKAEGPYINIEGNKSAPIFNEIDGSLFEDDNGAVYIVGHNHYIARMKDDLSDVAEPFRKLLETPYKVEPYLEGVYMVKHDGRYQLLLTAWSIHKPDGSFSYLDNTVKRSNLHSYDVVVAEADNVYGPYGPRYPAILEGGHNDLFIGKDGQWWSTTFFNPKGEAAKTFPVTCRPAVLAVKWVNGRLMPDMERTEKFYGKK